MAWIKRKEKGLGIAWNKGKKFPSKRNTVTLICRFCKKSFEVAPYRAKQSNEICCSRSCSSKYLQANPTIRMIDHWGKAQKAMAQSRIGLHHTGLAKLKMSENRKGKAVGEDNPMWKGGVSCCIDCGQKTTSINCVRCRICANEFYRDENGSNWKGGITSLNFGIRACMKYKNILIQSKQRDNYQCLMPYCDSDSNILHSNHIKRFSIILEGNNIKTLEDAYNCKELWNINNLITLCKPCHRHIRGREKQFENLFNLIIKKLYYNYEL